MKLKYLRIPNLLTFLIAATSSAFAQPVISLEDYKAPQITIEAASSGFDFQINGAVDISDLTVDTSNREEVRAFFNAIYWASQDANILWTGSFSPLPTPGTEETEVPLIVGDTSDIFKEAVLLRINFYRAMVGIPADIVLLDELNRISQLTALIMGGNDEISHFPDLDSFPNYVTADGITGAGDSNLAIGSYGPDSIDGYIQDKGAGNAAVGHRRWLLYPPMVNMGTGDVPSASAPGIPQAALDNIDTWRGGTTTTVRRANSIHVLSPENTSGGTFPTINFPYVAYPQEGYAPYQLVFPRWSFAVKDADFSGATVTMTRDGNPIAVAQEILDAPFEGGLGSNTLVWVYDGLDANVSQSHPKPTADVTYQVTVSGIASAPQTSYTYDVIVFDPEVPTSGETTVTSITGPAAPAVNAANEYTVALPAFAILQTNTNVTGIRHRSFNTAVGDFTEGAEGGIGSLVARVFGGYDPINTNGSFVASGGSSFQLATGEIGTNQSITFPESYLIGGSSELTFESMVRTATSTQIARVNLSLDGGVSWNTIFSQPGASSGFPDENAFSTKTIDLSAHSGRTINLQFTFDHIGSTAFVGASTAHGWFFDDISLSGVQSLSSITTSAFLPGATTFDFTPTVVGDVTLQAQGMLHDDYELEWGTALAVTATDAVTAIDDTNAINEGDDSVSGSVTANDSKPNGQTLTVDLVDGDLNNVGTRIATTYGHIQIDANGDYTYEIDNTNTDVTNLNDGETLEDSITYRTKDGLGNSDTGTLRVTITGKTISAQDDEDSIAEGDDYVKGSVTENDGTGLTVDQVDGDSGDVGTIIATDYGFLVINTDGSYAYRVDNNNPAVSNLNDGETLEETFTYRSSNGSGSTDTGTLRLTINGTTTVVEPANPGRLGNISTRAQVLTGDSVMIAGFVIGGTEPMDVLIRAIGPTLGEAPFNVSGSLQDPVLELYEGASLVNIPTNPNTAWGGTVELTDSMALVGAFALSANSDDAAIRTNLPAGPYTAIVKGVGATTGNGLVEVYNETIVSDPNANTRLDNIATRAVVGTGDALIIAGFVVYGTENQRVLIQAVSQDIPGTPALQNPTMTVFDQSTINVVEVGQNDDWEDNTNTAEIILIGGTVGAAAFVPGSSNSAIVLDLPSGGSQYGIHVRGVGNTTGNARVDVFTVDL